MIRQSKSAGHEGTDELRPSSYWNDPSIACMIGTGEYEQRTHQKPEVRAFLGFSRNNPDHIVHAHE